VLFPFSSAFSNGAQTLSVFDFRRNCGASSLVNGDDTGLDEEELEQLNAFTDYMVDKYGQCYCVDAKLDDAVFTSYHDANDFCVLACECAIFVFES
jgi:hypothetical protein